MKKYLFITTLFLCVIICVSILQVTAFASQSGYSVEEKLVSEQLADADAPQITGTLDTWRQFNTAQWLFTGLAAAEIAFSLYMAFVCIKRRPRLWGLWLFFIVFVYAGIAFPTRGDLIISFYIYTLGFPKILIIQGWGMKIFISLPVGAAVFYTKYGRNKIRKSISKC